MAGKVEKFPVSRAKRELNRRGKMSLSCVVTDRWIKVHDPAGFVPYVGGTPVEIEVVSAYSRSTGGDHKICSLIITVEQLQSLLTEIEKRRKA